MEDPANWNQAFIRSLEVTIHTWRGLVAETKDPLYPHPSAVFEPSYVLYGQVCLTAGWRIEKPNHSEMYEQKHPSSNKEMWFSSPIHCYKS